MEQFRDTLPKGYYNSQHLLSILFIKGEGGWRANPTRIGFIDDTNVSNFAYLATRG